MSGVISAVSANQGTLVQYIEVWHVEEDGQTMRLQSHARLRENVVDFGTSDRQIRSGEGIAGMAWNQRHAVILQEAPSELLQRIGTQNGLNLTALIAYPIMRGHDVLSVVVFGISDGPGAFEIWSRDDRDELSISASYYSGLKNLEFMSRYVRFPKGAGLPGTVWKTGMPKLAPDLAHSASFMRSFDADETPLSTGFGLPVGSTAGHSESILLLLSSSTMPIARAFEIWTPHVVTEESTEFQCIASAWDAADSDGDRPPVEYHATLLAAWTTGRPVFATETNSPSVRAMLAVPVYRSNERVAIVVFRS
ncbi:MAG: GAF domain-containing protein [Fuerstia sp.]|nr:GAF domain-containing protein [Fuerstiella sp.]